MRMECVVGLVINPSTQRLVFLHPSSISYPHITFTFFLHEPTKNKPSFLNKNPVKAMRKSRSLILPMTNPTKTVLLNSSNDELSTSQRIISPSSTLVDLESGNSFESKPLLSSAFTGDSDHSIVSNVEHVVDETSLIARLALKLLRYLGVGYRWIAKFLALGCYAILLIPGFLQVGYNYFSSTQIRRSIVYGDKPRNRLDLYLPKNSDGPKPVVAFITGGAWIIGYKAWGSLLGQHLSDRDIIVACIDYRNFPQGTMRDMIDDASRGISFVCNNIAEYGGDPNRVYLMGQSAGAHIAACTLIEQAIKEVGEGDSVTWSISQINAYFGLSGGYNLLSLVDHFHNRGLYRKIFLSIMGGEQSLQHYSPEIVIQDPNVRSAVSLLPQIVLFHGTADYSIPSDSSESFAATLQRHGVDAQVILYEGKTHTDVFVQDPMRGGSDQMFEDLVSIIHAGDEEALAKDATAPPRKRLVPEIMLKLARAVSPF